MKKIIILISVFTTLILSSCGNNGEKVYLDGAEADGFKVESIATATPAPTIAPEERDFRGLKWGMSLSDVTNNEGEGYKTIQEGVIQYNDLEVGGYPVDAEYSFKDGMLETCIYYTTHDRDNTSEYIADYKEMIERYTSKYGNPKYSEEKWGDGNSKNISSEKGLELGAMMYRTGWERGNTRVNLVLFKDDDSKIKIGIRYQAIDINGKGDVAPEGDIDI